MRENKENDNILIKRRIRDLLKKRRIRVNDKGIKKIDNHIKKYINQLVEAISYQLQLEGRKNLREKDLENAMSRLKKSRESFEI